MSASVRCAKTSISVIAIVVFAFLQTAVLDLRYRNLRKRRLPAGNPQTSSVQSPDAAEMQV
jgi:hypothetical protein